MPELPEVETTVRGVAPYVNGHVVVALEVRNPSLRWPVPNDLAEHIVGQSVLGVSRRGKYLLFSFKTGNLLVHLGMSGSLRMVDPATPLKTHDHVIIGFNNGMQMRYHDPRRFGCVLWTEDSVESHDLIRHLGPEPLSEAFDASYVYQLSRGRKLATKLFIMDSKVVVGVGNIYANEALFASGIHPTKPAGKLTKAACERLVVEIKKVLAAAIQQGGTTLRDFVNSDGQPGYFKQTLAVYGRGGEPCVTCGDVLREIRLGQRATVFCRGCQR
ncbi:MAG TPA: bifunctional DNA-formamidopyrimidine glycosylase/DNA-(apurinic or apyrimidinic site) lyase [Pseudomonadales bacterium]|nr:bifunctional DNA-formamidopyrimidine glycosylase/DNA-(apurinic or apyrimidinic site) lyase [Pseudomonadales bacterium]